MERLGIKPLAEEEFRLADGTKVVRKKGIALFRYGERVGGADVIFGEEGDYKLLGAFTLEALGLVLDPLKRELKPLPMALATLEQVSNDQKPSMTPQKQKPQVGLPGAFQSPKLHHGPLLAELGRCDII